MLGAGTAFSTDARALDAGLGAVQRLRALVDVGADLHVAAGEPERGDAQAEEADHQHHHQQQDRAALGVAVGASSATSAVPRVDGGGEHAVAIGVDGAGHAVLGGRLAVGRQARQRGVDLGRAGDDGDAHRLRPIAPGGRHVAADVVGPLVGLLGRAVGALGEDAVAVGRRLDVAGVGDLQILDAVGQDLRTGRRRRGGSSSACGEAPVASIENCTQLSVPMSRMPAVGVAPPV